MPTCEMRRQLSLLLFHLALLTAFARATRADDQAHVGEQPSWVLPVAVPEPTAGSERDTETLLIDEQGLVEADGDTRFVHVAYRVRTAAGLREASELSVERAADELLTWHYVRVHREGVARELLPALGIKVIQPESGLASGLLDGARRELVLVEDLRAGDTVEYAYSVRASNRTLAGRYTGQYRLAGFESARRRHLHLSWPPERTIAVRAVNVALERPTPSSLRYLQDDVPGQRTASHEPDQNDRTPRVELSEFQSWAELVAWAVPRYPAVATGEVAALAQRLRGQGALQDGVQAAIRFVQDEVRYLGIEEGERALVPHAPEQVLARRYGDCKDKSLLLVALLRAMGLRAEPALVSTYWNDAVAQALPSTRAFDHAVVHAQLGTQELWVDATRSLQRGPASAFTGLPFGRALLLREGERGLTVIPVRVPGEPDVVVHERFTLSSGNHATLKVETRYLGEQADSMRGKLANRERGDLQKSYVDFYGEHYGTVSVLQPVTIDDDPVENRLVVHEHYALSKFWQSGEGSVYAWLLKGFLPEPEASREARDYSLPYPIYARQIIELDDPDGWSTRAREEQIDGNAFSFTYSSRHTGKLEVVEHTLRTKQSIVPGAELKDYEEQSERARNLLASNYATGLPRAPDGETNLVVIALFLVFLIVLASFVPVRAYFARRRRTRQQPVTAGEAPHSAIAVPGLREAHAALRKIRCCNDEPFAHELPNPQQLRYDGKQLTVYRRACSACGRNHARYFVMK